MCAHTCESQKSTLHTFFYYPAPHFLRQGLSVSAETGLLALGSLPSQPRDCRYALRCRGSGLQSLWLHSKCVTLRALSIGSGSLLIFSSVWYALSAIWEKSGTVGKLEKKLRLRTSEATTLPKHNFSSISCNTCEYSGKWIFIAVLKKRKQLRKYKRPAWHGLGKRGIDEISVPPPNFIKPHSVVQVAGPWSRDTMKPETLSCWLHSSFCFGWLCCPYWKPQLQACFSRLLHKRETNILLPGS